LTNRLASASSPYLLQHADNPVHWYEWGPEALSAARRLDRPILLSVGYSSCHWCHVMAHESFEDEAMARAMNERFVNIKVDREERPDIDALYMEAVQAMTGQGGWPLTVFLTPDEKPFFGGTYYPPQPRHGMPGFGDVLAGVARAWSERREEIVAAAERVAAALARGEEPSAAAGLGLEASVDVPGDSGAWRPVIASAAAELVRSTDPVHGGFGGQPKFPNACNLAFLLARAVKTGDSATAGAVTRALDGMAAGGIRDQIGGGFHRYSVDASWTVPHFEKMLYDNAQLIRLYSEAGLGLDRPRFLAVAGDTADWALREMRDPDGAFLAALDADTTAGEGHYYTWTPTEVEAALSAAGALGRSGLAAVAMEWYGVSPGGNFEAGRSVLTTRRTLGEVAAAAEMSAAEAEAAIEVARAGLLEARARREAPGVDRKVVTMWNGLMIDALAKAGTALARTDLLDAAAAAARALLGRSGGELGGLAHSYVADRSGAPAFLEDFAALAGGVISLYEATLDIAWLQLARDGVELLLERFGQPVHAGDGPSAVGGLFRSSADHERLIARQREWVDGAVPSGNALAADALLRAGRLLVEERFIDAAHDIVAAGIALPAAAPQAAGAMLSVTDDAAAGSLEIAVVGAPAAAQAFWREVHGRHLPGAVRAGAPVGGGADGHPVPWVRDKLRLDHCDTALGYICRSRVCARPESSIDGWREALEGLFGTA